MPETATLERIQTEMGQTFSAVTETLEKIEKTAEEETGKRTELQGTVEKLQESFAKMDEVVDRLKTEASSAHQENTTTTSERKERMLEAHATANRYYLSEGHSAPADFNEFEMQHRIFPFALTTPSDKIDERCAYLEEKFGQGSPEVTYAKKVMLAISSGSADSGGGGALVPPAYTTQVWQSARMREPIIEEVFSDDITTRKGQRRLTTGNAVVWYADDSSTTARTENTAANSQQFYNQELTTNAAVVHLRLGEELVEDYPASLEAVIRETSGRDLAQALGEAVITGHRGTTDVSAFHNAANGTALSPKNTGFDGVNGYDSTATFVEYAARGSASFAASIGGRFNIVARVKTGSIYGLGVSDRAQSGQIGASGTKPNNTSLPTGYTIRQALDENADAKLEELFTSIKNEYRQNAALLISRRLFAKYATLKDSQGALLYRDWAVHMGTNNRNLKGERVIISEYMDDLPPADKPHTAVNGVLLAVYGDFNRGYTLFNRLGIRTRMFYVDPPFYNYYVRMRCAGGVFDNQALGGLLALS